VHIVSSATAFLSGPSRFVSILLAIYRAFFLVANTILLDA
jgi:hypothetical protein